MNANVAYQIAFVLKLPEPLGEDLAQSFRVRQQFFPFDRFDQGQSGAGGDGVAAEGAGMHAGPQAFGDLRRGRHGAAGQAAAKAR